MNEQIKKLAVEAGWRVDLGGEILEGDDWHIQTDVVERFAELIVKECAELFPLAFTDEHYQRRIDKTILKHFGLWE